jgi:hypothetical protein
MQSKNELVRLILIVVTTELTRGMWPRETVAALAERGRQRLFFPMVRQA